MCSFGFFFLRFLESPLSQISRLFFLSFICICLLVVWRMVRQREKKCSGLENGGEDRVSSLPVELREEILALLPIKDAVKTSVLSRDWRYCWASVPDLRITTDEFASLPRFVRFVDDLFMLRVARIRTFSMVSTEEALALVSEAIDRWMVTLSKNKIEEAKILIHHSENYGTYRIPSCVFSCMYLKKLELRSCTIKLPANFKGFPLLTKLKLKEFFASESDLERLIRSCPILKILYLFGGTVGNLSVCSPSLRELGIVGQFGKLNLQTPKLVELFIHVYLPEMTVQQEKSNFNCVFGQCLHSITIVQTNCLVLKHLGFSYFGDKLPIPGSFDMLKAVDLSIDPTYPYDAAAGQCLFKNAPNIEFLYIRFGYNFDGELPISLDPQAHSSEQCLLPHLKMLTFCQFFGCGDDLAFLEYLLLNSPSLKLVEFRQFGPVAGLLRPDLMTEPPVLQEKVVQLQRASRKATFIFGH